MYIYIIKHCTILSVMISKYHIKRNVCLKKLLDQKKILSTKISWLTKNFDKKSFGGNIFFGWINLVSKKFGNKILVKKSLCRKNSLILKMFAPNNWWWVSKPILVIDLGPCPTLGQSISFPCCQLQCAAQEVTMSISAFLCPLLCSLIFYFGAF